MVLEPPRRRLLALFFIGSGFSAVAYQVLLSRYIQLVVGTTAYAVSALLVAFMLGTSVGSALGGRAADRATHPLRLYAVAEGAIGVYCLCFPLLFPRLQALYLHLAPPLTDDALGARNAVRFALGVAAFLVPSIFMGFTTPAFARAVVADRADREEWLVRLYGWNTLGAGLGALATAYVVVPLFGLKGGMAGVSTINFAVAFIAYRLATPVGVSAPSAETPALGPKAHAMGRRHLGTLLLLAASTGFLSFALEVIWTHLLAILLGNSVYAFGLMLGSLLLGLWTGTLFARRLARPESRLLGALGASVAGAGLVVILTLGVWDRVPAVFLLLGRSSPSFFLMEAARFTVALLLMLVPTALLGISFPLILGAMSSRAALGARVGAVYMVNTLGAVAGALAAPYLILPALGSLDSLRLLGATLLAVGGAGMLLLASFPMRRLAGVVALSSLIWVWWIPVYWDLNALSSAASIYLGRSESQTGSIVYHREDPTGGLTTVVESHGVRTLLTNGKFQGDSGEEVPIQHRLANIPTLFTPGRRAAMVIGLGTGVTLASLAAHGFEQVVCAELSRPIVEAARLHFRDVNGDVLAWPSVRLIQEDGRSVLLESPRRYDVVTIEVNSIWFAGMGSIYSEEFYRLVSRRLNRQGVLLQWFPLHHLSTRNLFVVVNTARTVFPHVSLWAHRHQAFVLASNEPLLVDLESARSDQQRPLMKRFLGELQSGSPVELLSDLAVTDRSMDGFLDDLAHLLQADRRLVSTDTWPTLEYETPKDVLNHLAFFQNQAVLRRFRSREPFPFRGTPTPDEEALASAAFTLGWQDPRAIVRLGKAWAADARLSEAVSRWVLDETTEPGVVGAGYPEDPLEELKLGVHHVSALVEGGGGTAECRADAPALPALASIPLVVEGHAGGSVRKTRPEAAVDGNPFPELGNGWLVRSEGANPYLQVRLDRPRRVVEVDVVLRTSDGSGVRSRVLGRDTEGRWHPLGGGGQLDEIRCQATRVLRLDGSLPMTALRVELQGESQESRIALHEVRAIEGAPR
jgi:spermidine synthase